MLACARIGAAHSVVFGGFSADALRDRLVDGQAKVVVTADGGWRKDAIVPLKDAVDKALAEGASATVQTSWSSSAPAKTSPMQPGRDIGGMSFSPVSPPIALPNPSTAKICCLSSIPPAAPANPRALSIPPVATTSIPTSPRSGFSTSKKTTSTGVPPMSAGLPDTATLSTGPCPTARPQSCMKVRPAPPILAASGM